MSFMGWSNEGLMRKERPLLIKVLKFVKSFYKAEWATLAMQSTAKLLRLGLINDQG